jgi:hypothetical protein
MRLIRSCDGVKETKGLENIANGRFPLRKKIKNLKKAGNKMAGSFVSSIVFP